MIVWLIRCTNTIRELLAAYAGLVLVSATLFSVFEGRPWLDGLWWACVTAMTVGYGDLSPATMGGRAVAIVLMHLSVLFILPLMIGRVLRVLMEDEA